jgi:hypothetical protein
MFYKYIPIKSKLDNFKDKSSKDFFREEYFVTDFV